jgi:hypothetical protein
LNHHFCWLNGSNPSFVIKLGHLCTNHSPIGPVVASETALVSAAVAGGATMLARATSHSAVESTWRRVLELVSTQNGSPI